MKRIYLAITIWTCVAGVAMAGERWTSFATLEKNIQRGDYGTLTSILIKENGKIIYEGYFNGADVNTLHNTRSVTKTVTGMAVGAAVDAGLLDVDTHAARFFSDITPFKNPDPRKWSITIEDLITMSSVLECDDNDPFSRGNEARMHNVEDWASFFWDLPIRGYPSWVKKPENSKYGRTFAYCSAGVEMAGQVVERVAKTTFQHFVQTKFFEPMEIEHFEWPENGVGQAHKSGGLLMTTRDLAKLAEMQRIGGVHNGRRILSQAWTQESVKPRVVANTEEQIEYGYLWWRSEYEVSGKHHETYSMSGNGGNRVVVMPTHNLVVVVTKTDFNKSGMHQQTDKLLTTEIIARLAN